MRRLITRMTARGPRFLHSDYGERLLSMFVRSNQPWCPCYLRINVPVA